MGGMAMRRVAGWLGLISTISGKTQRRVVVGADPDAAWRKEVRQVMFFSGLCGLFLGLDCGWQIAVESAQAVAGVASYPVDNPFYLYHIKTWTLLHQLPALLLFCGMPESWLSMLLSALAGVISFQAMALCCYAFCKDRWFACSLPLVCHVTNVCRDLQTVHQVRLLSSDHWAIYGVVGTLLVIYAWSLLGVGRRRSGAFLLGLSLAVHPVLGAWCLAIGAFSLACEWRRDASGARTQAPWLAAGVCASALSFAVQCFLARGLPPVDGELSRQLAAAFAADWDNHRMAVPLGHLTIVTAACATMICWMWLRFGAATLPPRSIVLMRCLAYSAPLGLLLGLLTHWQDHLPLPVVMAMPGRFNDVIAIAFPVLVLGLLVRERGKLFMHALFSLVMVFFVLKMVMMTTHRIYIPPAPKVMLAVGWVLLLSLERIASGASEGSRGRMVWPFLRIAGVASLWAAAFAWRHDARAAIPIGAFVLGLLGLCTSFHRWRRVEFALLDAPGMQRLLYVIDAACLATIAAVVVGPWFAFGLAAGGLFLTRRRWLPAVEKRFAAPDRWRGALTAALVCAAAGVLGAGLWGQARAYQARLNDWTNDPVFAAISQGRGLTLTASRIALMQLQTRRGVLLYGAAMNQLTYVPASAPKINEILRKVYGDDILEPRPENWIRCGGLMPGSGRELWAAREPEEWAALAREFGFTDVVAYADWKIKLPLIARNRKYAAYHVPGSESPGSESYVERAAGAARHSLARLPSNSASITADTSLPSVGE
jgi:hypothetical protein